MNYDKCCAQVNIRDKVSSVPGTVVVHFANPNLYDAWAARQLVIQEWTAKLAALVPAASETKAFLPTPGRLSVIALAVKLL